MHYRSLVRKRFLYFRRDIRGLLCEIFIPILIIWLGFLVTRIEIVKNGNSADFKPSIFEMPGNQVWVNSGFELLTNLIPNSETKII